MVRQYDPRAAVWMWGDGLSRSVNEATQAQARYKLNASSLGSELDRLRSAMAALFKARTDIPAIVVPRWWDLWLVLVTSAFLTLAILLFLFAQRLPSSPDPAEHLEKNPMAQAVEAAGPVIPPAPTLWGVDPAVNIDELVATGRYEVIDDGFGRQLRGPLEQWNFYSTDVARPLEVVARARASAEQSAFALVSGTLLMQPYPRRGVSALLAVRVPTTRGVGYMIFNTRDRKLMDEEVRLVRVPLIERTWYQLGSKRIGYLGSPEALRSEISLAPP